MRSSRRNAGLLALGAMGLLLVAPTLAEAAKIGAYTESNWRDQAMEFINLANPAVRNAVFGALALGCVCGIMGCFILVRKLALMGDTISHAVLPGVAIGFLWNQTKDPVAIFVGAVIAGLIGTSLTHLIRKSTILKEDAALGLILGGFYGIGIVLLRLAMNLESGNKAGLDKILFGQVAALSSNDVLVMSLIALIVTVLVAVLYKELQVISFDITFARSLGIPAQAFHYLTMLLLTVAVVISLQAVGVVLVSAMLITPAAAAYLLTDRLHRMILLAAVFGMMAGLLGAFFSYLETGLPTGPFMVLGASAVFLVAYFFAPRYGVIPRLMLHVFRKKRIGLENTLKAVFQVRESGGFSEEGVILADLAMRRNIDLPTAEREARALVRQGWASLENPGNFSVGIRQRKLFLTPEGWEQSCKVVRNHRLWELYLTNAAQIQSDHVHDDAEVIEHILGEEIVAQIEKRLDFPTRDPHGKVIPSQRDMDRGFLRDPSPVVLDPNGLEGGVR